MKTTDTHPRSPQKVRRGAARAVLAFEVRRHGHLSDAGSFRLLMDAAAIGESRVFGIEALSADPLFVHLAGGVLPSLDTVYRDLRRFDDEAISDLEQMMAEHGLVPVRTKRRTLIHLDVDTTVEPVFGNHEGALPGPYPRYRQSYLFASDGLLRRNDYVADVVGALARGAHGWDDFATADGIPVPTRRTVVPRLRNWALAGPIVLRATFDRVRVQLA